MDYRTCGAGLTLATRPYHAGLSDDAAAALRFIERLCPDSPLGLVGYSMGGNVALRTLGAHADDLPASLVRAATVNPAVDLAVCCDYLTGPMQRFYDRHFAKALTRHAARHPCFAETCRDLFASPALRIREFDERFTVRHWGFGSVEEYYATASAARFVKEIRVPTLILHSRDDPLIPDHLFESLDWSDAVTVHLTDHGGHLGYIGVGGVDPDRRWMDWRVADWLTGRVGPADVPQESPGRGWRLTIPGRRTRVEAEGVELAVK
jgi:predicted alpha/beta-fold hydrolase